ncbi:MAG: FeS assembly protein SufD [Acidimicrobiales bacterium]|nr:FeS assembly protein SufD [Acidimicrobiales bacterium]
MTPDAEAVEPGAEWLRARRAGAAERFATTPLPTDAEEVWRYSRVAELELDDFSPRAGSGAVAVPANVQQTIDATGPWSGVAVAIDGRLVSIALDDDLAGKGVIIRTAGDADEDTVGRVAVVGVDAFTELNAAWSAPVVVQVPAGVVVERPLLLVHWLGTDGVAAFPHTTVVGGANSEVTVVEYHGSADVHAFVDPVVELDVGDAARMRYLNLQDLGDRVWQIGYQASRVGRDASLLSAVVALGGDYARVRTDSRLAGKGGSASLMALYFGDGGQMHDFRTMQDHAAPNTTSDLLFKGAVADHSRSVYTGLIRVAKEAVGTNAFQTNRNLVLSEGASAESVPNLEIETNQVQCSHASAVGPIDEEQRFYLESRGVPTEVADRLIVLGFFGEVLERLPVRALTARLREAVADKLAGRRGRLASP